MERNYKAYLILSLLFSLIIKLNLDLAAEVQLLKNQNDDLIRLCDELKNPEEKQQIVQGISDNRKLFLGIGVVIIAIISIAYLGGIDPSNMGDALNSLGNQGADVEKTVQSSSAEVSKLINTSIGESLKVLGNSLKAEHDFNQSWFKIISNQISSSNEGAFFNGKPPKFK